jgi:hypothetical protein
MLSITYKMKKIYSKTFRPKLIRNIGPRSASSGWAASGSARRSTSPPWKRSAGNGRRLSVGRDRTDFRRRIRIRSWRIGRITPPCRTCLTGAQLEQFFDIYFTRVQTTERPLCPMATGPTCPGTDIMILKYFCQKNRRKNWHFILKTNVIKKKMDNNNRIWEKRYYFRQSCRKWQKFVIIASTSAGIVKKSPKRSPTYFWSKSIHYFAVEKGAKKFGLLPEYSKKCSR